MNLKVRYFQMYIVFIGRQIDGYIDTIDRYIDRQLAKYMEKYFKIRQLKVVYLSKGQKKLPEKKRYADN